MVAFLLNGRTVGNAKTNGQGVATLGQVSLAGLNAGTYRNAVTARFAGSLVYQQNAATGTLTVGKAQAAVSLDDLTQTYDGTTKSVTVSTNPSGLAYTVSYTDANGDPATSPTAAGSYHVNATITNPNYTGSATGSLVVAPAPLSVTGITASNKVYDGTTGTTLDTSAATLSGVVGGDDVTLETGGAAGMFDTKSAGTGKAVTISGLAVGGADASNYVLEQPATTANITAATLTVTGITANTKGYDGTTNATLNTAGAVLVGGIAGDDLALDVSGATGTFNSPDIGTGKTVTVSGLALSGSDASNYLLVQPTTSADITVGTLTVTGITASNKVYDGTSGAAIDTSAAVLSGVVAGEDVTLDVSGATGSFASKNAGTGKTVTISGLTLSGADAGKYILTEATTTADIAAATLTVSGITASNKVYDGTTGTTLDTSAATLSGVVGGDDVTLETGGAAGMFDTKSAGTGKTVTISGLAVGGADASNYVLEQPTTTANITAATLTVTGITANTKGYDGTTNATLNTAGAVLVGGIAGDDLALDVSGATGTFNSPDIGTGKTVTVSGLALSGSDASNYLLVQPTTSADITVGTLTVTGITASNKVYDGTSDATIDTSAAVLSGVVAGEDVTLDVSGATGSFASKNAGTGKTVTISGLTLSGADAGKYILAEATTTADIAAATLTVSGITASDKVYDGTSGATIDTSAAELSGVLAGDDVTLETGGVSGVFDTKDAGTGKTVTVSGLVLSGADAANYVLEQPTTTADITAATLTVTGVTASNKVYDGTIGATLDTSAAALSGVVAGDDVTLETGGVSGVFDTKDAGTGKTVTVSGLVLSGADAANYVLSSRRRPRTSRRRP